MTKIIETTENVRKTAINNLFEGCEELKKDDPFEIDVSKFEKCMGNVMIGLHQIGINLETIQKEKDELIQALIFKCKYQCGSIPSVICQGCNDYRNQKLAVKHTGKSIEELLNIKCPECGGTGEDSDSGHPVVLCYKCNGTGKSL